MGLYSSKNELVLLAPSRVTTTDLLRKPAMDTQLYEDLLASMQRFRGKVYLDDGAIQREELTPDGRHKLNIDEQSWHVLSIDHDGHIRACLRYLDERRATGFDDLWVRHAYLSRCPQYGSRFRSAVTSEMQRARSTGLGFGEVGGWAVAPEQRASMEALRILLATFGLLQLLGGCVGVATATFRHGSANILRKIGLGSLLAGGTPLPPYYDPQYRCQMEVLHFDSRSPNPKYRDAVFEHSLALMSVPVVCRASIASRLQGAFRRLEHADAMSKASELVHVPA
jgi:hypothetical protein